jgi:agarase
LTIGLLISPSAFGQAQSPEQQRCLRSLNLGFERMAKAQGKEARTCLQDAATGTLTGAMDDCLRADGRAHIERRRTRNATSATTRCDDAQPPDFGAPDVATSNATGVQSQENLLRGVFGPDLDTAIATEATDRDRSKCQQQVYKAVDRCQQMKLKSFQHCIASGLAHGTIGNASGLAACADSLQTPASPGPVPIPYPRIARVCGGEQPGHIQRRVEKRCVARNVDLTEAFPGCAAGDAATVAACLDRQVECHVCLALNQVDFLDRNCDAFDDGISNDSCIGRDRWGGWTGVERTATGRFRVEEVDGVWWFITPDGHGFFSAGVNNVNPNGDFSPPIGTRPYQDNILALYGTKEAWQEVTYDRLQRWNFNTVGAFGPIDIHVGRRPYTPIRDFHQAAPAVPGWPAGQTGKLVRDFFDPAWPTGAAARAADLQYCADDPFCVGAFTDNELPWGPSVFMVGTFVDAYMTLPADAPGKLALQQFFEDRYSNDITAFNAGWELALTSFDDLQGLDTLGSDIACEPAARTDDRRAFMRRVAERYFSVVHDALRALDPELLILGTRFTTTALGPDLVTAAAPYVDVLSVNHYLLAQGALNIFAGNGGVRYEYFFLDNRFEDLATIHALSGRPLMITEYTIRTPTPDVPVLFPPFFPTFDTQAERTDAYEEYQRQVLSRPYMIGTHWFEYWDQPATGRGDGENSRFGVVDIEDTVYPEITARMTLLNSLVPERPIPPPTPDIFPASATSPIGPASSLEAAGPIVVAPAAAGTLGDRVFSIAPSGSDRTGFYVGILPGQNLGSSVSGGPLILEGGEIDGSGNAPIALKNDAVIGLLSIVGDVLCLRLEAAGSSGTVSCDGGIGHDVAVTRDAGDVAPPAVTQTFLGVDSGSGAATLLVPTEVAQLPAGATLADCATTDQYEPQQVMAFSTGIVTTTKGTEQLHLQGENFECGVDGASWQVEDGPGMLSFGLPVFDSRVPGGDLASGLLFADRADACP